jgi:hypothetical protein
MILLTNGVNSARRVLNTGFNKVVKSNIPKNITTVSFVYCSSFLFLNIAFELFVFAGYLVFSVLL